jgi:23S rRNA (guanosine2251-2'-O)-methyltransferase
METEMARMARKNKRKVIVVCHNLRSAYNVGSIFRTADGAGVAKVYLTGYTPAPPHIGISKTALGAEKVVLWERFQKVEKVFEQLRKEKFQIVALEQDARSVPYNRFQPKEKVAIVLGNELRGISKETLGKCDKIIEIPMRGEKESLNVSVAFGIAAYFLTSNVRNA